MPTRDQVWRRFHADPQFAADYTAAMTTIHRTGYDAGWKALLNDLAAGVSVAASCRLPGRPSTTAFHERLQRDAAFREEVANFWNSKMHVRGTGLRYSKQNWTEILAAIERGHSIKRLSEIGPSSKTFYAYIRRDPQLATGVQIALARRSQRMLSADRSARSALTRNELWRAANARVPHALSPHDRNDIISEILVAVFSGEIAAADIPRVARKFVAAHAREFANPRIGSLDVTEFEGGRLMVSETIDADALHF